MRLLSAEAGKQNSPPMLGDTERIKLKAWLLVLCLLQISAAQSPPSQAPEIRVHLQRAQAALKAHAPEVAGKEFRAILALDPKNAEAHTNLGVIAFSRGDYRSAESDFREALAVAPALVQAQALLGICEKRLGGPSAGDLLENSFQKLKDTKLRTQVGVELAGMYYQKGDLDRSATVVRFLVELNPEDVEILFMAQRVYAELADDTMNKLALLAPGSARMQQIIAEHLVNGGDLKSAIDHYKKALEIDPHLPGVRYELAEAILESVPADPAVRAEAEKELQTAIAVDGDSARIQCELGRIALMKSDTEQAYAHYTRAYTLNPHDAEAQAGMGKLLMTMQKPQEAIQYLRKAVQSDPLNEASHYRLGLAYRKVHMPDEAQKELKLFQDIKQTKDQVKELYRQMNKRAAAEDKQTSNVQ